MTEKGNMGNDVGLAGDNMMAFSSEDFGSVRAVIINGEPWVAGFWWRRPYEVYHETFLSTGGDDAFDTEGILYVITPEDARVRVGRFFDLSGDEPREIYREEYDARRGVAE